jgi:hypothetical protein
VSNVAPILVPNTGGAMRSFGHCRLNLNGQDFTGGFENLKWTIDNDSEAQFSNNPDPVGFSLGENKYSASVQLYYDFALTLIQAIGPGWQMIPFAGYFTFVGVGLTPYTDVLLACRLTKIELSAQAGQGGKAITLPIELKPLKILPAGIDGNLYPLSPNTQ